MYIGKKSDTFHFRLPLSVSFGGNVFEGHEDSCGKKDTDYRHGAAYGYTALFKFTHDEGGDGEGAWRRHHGCGNQFPEGNDEDHHESGEDASENKGKSNGTENVKAGSAERPSGLYQTVTQLDKGGGGILHGVGKVESTT